MGFGRRIFRALNGETVLSFLAARYDRAIGRVFESYLGEFARGVLERFPAGRILDVGAGTGNLLIELARRSPGLRGVGVDLSRRFLAVAGRNAKAQGLCDRVGFHAGDAATLPFGDASFDAVVSTCALHHLRRPECVLSECRRVLSPEGEFWLLDIAREASPREVSEWVRAVKRETEVGLPFAIAFRLELRLCAYATDEVSAMAQGAGFRRLSLERRGVFLRGRFARTM